jgi:hypothetical protein
MKLSPLALTLTGLALVAAGTLASAQIERLDLPQMVAKADQAVFGTITSKEVIRIESSVDGPELYFTSLHIDGYSLKSGEPYAVDAWFPGGFINATEGVHNSEAPSADDQMVGNKIVAFTKWSPNMGGGLAGQALYASHGGLYRTFENRSNVTVVQGRGEGYAIPTNITLSDLDGQIQ